MFVDVDLEALAIAPVLPIGDGVTDAIEERTAPEVDVTDKHAAKMTEVADSITARPKRQEELYCGHRRHIGAHRNAYGEGD